MYRSMSPGLAEARRHVRPFKSRNLQAHRLVGFKTAPPRKRQTGLLACIRSIQSSPRGPRSAFIAVGDAFFAELSRRNAALTVDTLNVWDEHLPEFDAEAIEAKYRGLSGEPMDPAEDTLWHVRGGMSLFAKITSGNSV